MLKLYCPSRLNPAERPQFAKLDGKHRTFRTSEEKRQNLYKLADFLWLNREALDQQFNMAFYLSGTGTVPQASELEEAYECGTVACAVGWAPYAGIASKHREQGWDGYAKDRLGLNPIGCAWEWVACSSWKYTDNSPAGAAKRIYYMLEYGVPIEALEDHRVPKPLEVAHV